ncbi:MAG: hypothetical protein M3O68_01995 [Thermoproteota archaeon]|nr:hypothetical protein [Thermoproteota archaeon]
MTLVDELGKQFVHLRMELRYPLLKFLENAYIVAPQAKMLEIKRDEWLLLRDAKAQNLQLTTKPLVGIKYKGIVIAGIK